MRKGAGHQQRNIASMANEHAKMHRKLNRTYEKGLDMLKAGRDLKDVVVWLRASYRAVYQLHDSPAP